MKFKGYFMPLFDFSGEAVEALQVIIAEEREILGEIIDRLIEDETVKSMTDLMTQSAGYKDQDRILEEIQKVLGGGE